MDSGAWWATVHGVVVKVGYNWATNILQASGEGQCAVRLSVGPLVPIPACCFDGASLIVIKV